MPDADQPAPIEPTVEVLDPALVAALDRGSRARLADEVAAHLERHTNAETRLSPGSVATLVRDIAFPAKPKAAPAK